MEITAESCQTCFKPMLPPGTPTTQWFTYCRCDKPYKSNSQFSIDICAKCCKRARPSGTGLSPDLCACEEPDAKKVPTYIKQNEKDPVSFDIATVGLTENSFPVERYVPLALLGNAGRATVILARDKTRGTKVAVKCFKNIPANLHGAFQSEAKKNQLMNHTSIAKIVDVGVGASGAPYLVTEYKDGYNLAQYLALYGVPSYDVAVKILLDVCEALLYAQKQSVMHRDLRPGNVIFIDDQNAAPTVVVTDFAMPKIKAAEKLGDPVDALYMSADEARNLDFSEKSEVYTLGCLGYSLLTAKAPYEISSAQDLKNSHALKLPVRISSVNFDNKRPRDLEEVMERCLEKDPGQRFETVEKFKERLEVFPRRVQMQIAAILAARLRAKILKIVLIVLAVGAVCGVAFFALRGGR